MRLYNIYFICASLAETINGLEFMPHSSNPQISSIVNWGKYVDALIALRKISMFERDVDDIYNTMPVFVREHVTPTISNDIAKKLQTKNQGLCNRINTIVELYESMNLRSSKHGIDVKIPHCSELKEYISYLKDVDFVFTQCPYLRSKDEKIEFDSVDVGSNWLNFIISVAAGSAAVYLILNNLAILLDKALILKAHYNSIKQQEETLKIAQKKATLVEAEVEIFETIKKQYMRQVVDELKEDISPLQDGEEEGKVEKSLEKLVGLLDKGVEIYASLDAPKEIQVLFPPIDEANSLPDNLLKFIEDKKATEE